MSGDGNGNGGGRQGATPDRLGRPIRDLRISVTDRCNFRCTYCMPAELFGDRYNFIPKPEILSFEEIERLVRLLVPMGVHKLRITGGEPLVRHDLPKLIGALAAVPGVDDIAMTTNGTLLPKFADQLHQAGLKRVTVSLDSLDPAVYSHMNGNRMAVARVLEGIAAAEQAGFSSIKINTVVQKGVNDDSVLELARHFKGSGHVLRFIEFMDVGTRNGWNLEQVLSAREITQRIDAEFPLEPAEANYPGEVARRWRYRDGSGEIGVIASVTQPFCGGCTRARLTTDGRLVTCLFASAGTSLRDPMREGASDADLSQLLEKVWGGRSDRYSEQRSEIGGQQTPAGGGEGRIEMYQVGG